MSAENNRRGFRVLGPKDTVETVGEATIVRHGSIPKVVPPPFKTPIQRLKQNLAELTELHTRLKKMIEELEELCR